MPNICQEYILVVISFLLSMVCGLTCIPYIIRFCSKKGLYDIPNGRKVHKNAIPRLGGISFMPSMLLASLVVMGIYNLQSQHDWIHINTSTVGFLISLLIIYGIGIVDDLVGLGPKAKFMAQIIAAAVLPMSGLYINNLYGFCFIHEIPFLIGAPLTLFVVVYICNAINLIDGIDGLSAGLSFIALSGFLLYFFRENMLLYCILIAGLMGVLVAFLYYNVFGKSEKNRKIFMGDSGSLTLGYTLGFLAVKLIMDRPHTISLHADSFLLAYSFVLVPCFDVARVSFIRICHHVNIFHADKNHIHHKLMRSGLSQHRSLLVIYSLAVFFILANYGLHQLSLSMTAIVIIDIVFWIVFHKVLNWGIVRNGQPVYLVNAEE